MEFQQVQKNLWCVRQPLDLFGIDMGTVMTIVRLRDRTLVVHAPLDPTEELIAAINELGTVKTVISPNRFNNQNVKRFVAHYPNSCYYYATGLDGKVPRRVEGVGNKRELDESINAQWHGELEALHITGMPFVNEYVFYHKASRTLIASELLANIEHGESLVSRIFWPMLGIKVGTPGQSRLFRFCIRDKSLYNDSIQQLLEWDINRVILNHGNMIEAQGSEILESLKAV